MVPGYHIYKEVWESNIGERLACETGNFYEFDALFCNPEERTIRKKTDQGPFVKTDQGPFVKKRKLLHLAK